jgi:hypothetical protein
MIRVGDDHPGAGCGRDVNQMEDRPVESVAIPAWLVKFIVGSTVVAIPWFAWATITLVRIEVTAEDYTDTIKIVRAHLIDPDLHKAARALINQDISDLRRRMSRLEDKETQRSERLNQQDN